MTEKRFTFHHDVDGIDYIEDESNGFCLICDELMCSLLNELHEENEQLKQDIKQVLFVISCAELDFKLSVNEAKAIKRLNDYVNGCFNTEKLGDVE